MPANRPLREPNAPATQQQISFMHKLNEKGIITNDELAYFHSQPTRLTATALISSHENDPGFDQARQELHLERSTSQPAPGTPDKETQQVTFAHTKIPAAFVTPHTVTRKDGTTQQRAYVHLPQGVEINGLDVSGYSFDIPLNPRQQQQLLNKESINISLREDRPITIWKGSKENGDYISHTLNDPWGLVTGIKNGRENYLNNRTQASDRAATHTHEAGSVPSLGDVAREARNSAAELGGGEENRDRPVEER